MDSAETTLRLQEMLDQGEWDRALPIVERQITLEPEKKQWPLVRASILLRQGKLEESLTSFKALLSRYPDYLDAWVNLAQIYRATGNLRHAVNGYQKALAIDPDNILSLRGLAECGQALGDPVGAATIWERLARNDEKDARAWQGIAECKHGSEPQAAVTAGKKALALSDDPAIRHVLAKAQVNAGAFAEATTLFKGLAELPEWRRAGLQGIAACLLYQGKCEPAFMAIQHFCDAGGEKIDAALMEAKAHVQMGNKESAIVAYRKAITIEPENVDALFGILNVTPELASEIDIDNFLSKWECYPVLQDKMLAAFSIARWYEEKGDRAAQIQWLDRANEIQNLLRPFKPDHLSALYDSSRRLCTRKWFVERAQTKAPPGPQPILVCGMPRSGTTLVEQMLGALPEVTARGENRAHIQAAHKASAVVGTDDLSGFYPRFNSKAIKAFQDSCRHALVEEEGVTTDYFTSKAMDLVLKLGMLVVAYPNARVIHIKRHPLDVGLGCYKQYFAQGQEFSNCWHGIAMYYSHFHCLMEHWSSIFPDRIKVVRYEDLVADPQRLTRSLAEHCGLDWSPKMLSFHKSSTTVTTASATQVRQGLFSHAAGRWQRYGELLSPLMDALDAEGVDWHNY